MQRRLLKMFIVLLSIFSCSVWAQAQDKLTMTNGEKREGKVVSVKDDGIKFVYKGETLEYEFKRSEINKIEFASGRVEVINEALSSHESALTAAERKNKIAVLPYRFITNEPGLDPQAMAEQLQADTYNSIKSDYASLHIQDPITTNSILAKHGINYASLNSSTPKEMAVLLGVEFVVYGIANVTNKGTSSYGSGSSVYKGKESEKKETTKASGTVYSSNSGTILTNYDTKIDLNFFNDQGASLYSQSRVGFGSGADAYHATISYLIKRSPFGTKAKK